MIDVRQLILGWVDHTEREHQDVVTGFPTWLCSMDDVHAAVKDGDVVQIEAKLIGPRHGSFILYGLTYQGRQKFYAALPRAGDPTKHLYGNEPNVT